MARFKRNEMNQSTGFVSMDLAFNSKERATLVSLPTLSKSHVSTNRVASLADLPGAAEMKASGLLAMDLPSGFAPPQPTSELGEDEDPLDADDAPEFAQDFLGREEG